MICAVRAHDRWSHAVTHDHRTTAKPRALHERVEARRAGGQIIDYRKLYRCNHCERTWIP